MCINNSFIQKKININSTMVVIFVLLYKFLCVCGSKEDYQITRIVIDNSTSLHMFKESINQMNIDHYHTISWVHAPGHFYAKVPQARVKEFQAELKKTNLEKHAENWMTYEIPNAKPKNESSSNTHGQKNNTQNNTIGPIFEKVHYKILKGNRGVRINPKPKTTAGWIVYYIELTEYKDLEELSDFYFEELYRSSIPCEFANWGQGECLNQVMLVKAANTSYPHELLFGTMGADRVGRFVHRGGFEINVVSKYSKDGIHVTLISNLTAQWNPQKPPREKKFYIGTVVYSRRELSLTLLNISSEHERTVSFPRTLGSSIASHNVEVHHNFGEFDESGKSRVTPYPETEAEVYRLLNLQNLTSIYDEVFIDVEYLNWVFRNSYPDIAPRMECYIEYGVKTHYFYKTKTLEMDLKLTLSVQYQSSNGSTVLGSLHDVGDSVYNYFPEVLSITEKGGNVYTFSFITPLESMSLHVAFLNCSPVEAGLGFNFGCDGSGDCKPEAFDHCL